ncbi:MAG TPA: DNA-binding protein WhiA [Candidatus Borkfalkia excrementigallinarum]|uniref:Probable cell division protein WhiA n=1 Tax=Candidatus Borkfalkia excrementigallinarum TaxID=2838506 RepID=A0A9D1ZVR7_9FIRM|nr:DNA-binding protein WhiA [Candidatus Borkfalkia excrementigallinarum]
MKNGIQNFTGEIKREIMKAGFDNACCKTAALSAFLRATGSIVRRAEQIGFEFITESEAVAEFFISLLEELYGAELKIVQATTDNRNGKDRLVFQCLSEKSLYILTELGIAERVGEDFSLNLTMDRYLVENQCCKLAYIKGAFLGSGSCTLPKLEDARSGYHMEVVFYNKLLADGYCELLALFDILAKSVERKGARVIYLKSIGSISDFLNLLGAYNSLEKLDDLATRKDERNQINRVANCMQKNFDKSVLASVKQIRAIETIESTLGLEELDPALRETALARLADKEASLKELAERLQISKSCLNHRLRKLVKISEELEGE